MKVTTHFLAKKGNQPPVLHHHFFGSPSLLPEEAPSTKIFTHSNATKVLDLKSKALRILVTLSETVDLSRNFLLKPRFISRNLTSKLTLTKTSPNLVLNRLLLGVDKNSSSTSGAERNLDCRRHGV